MRTLVIAAIVLATSACRDAPAPPSAAPSSAPSAAAPAASASVAAVAAEAPAPAHAIAEETPLYVLEYKYPAAAASIPAVRSWLDEDIARQRRELIAEGREDEDSARNAGFEYRKHGRWIEWKVVTNLAGWLSLSQDLSAFAGGAHPNSWFDARVWDRKAGKLLEPINMFTSKAALSEVIRRDFCTELDRQRRQKRGDADLGGMFNECVDPVASTVIVGSSDGRAFNRIGVLVPPYEAGPYAEGAYEVTLPVTDAVLATVRPEYRAAFAVKR